MHFVYDFVDPDDVPFYVGITDNPNERYQSHMTDTSSNPGKVAKIQGLLAAHLCPKMRIIEIVDTLGEARKREKYWIHVYTTQGIVLTNIIHLERLKISPASLKSIPKPAPFIPAPIKEHMVMLPRLKSQGYQWLTFRSLDETWQAHLESKGANHQPIEVTLLMLSQFVTELRATRTLRAKEQRDLEIWSNCKDSQLKHPERFPFCNVP